MNLPKCVQKDSSLPFIQKNSQFKESAVLVWFWGYQLMATLVTLEPWRRI